MIFNTVGGLIGSVFGEVDGDILFQVEQHLMWFFRSVVAWDLDPNDRFIRGGNECCLLDFYVAAQVQDFKIVLDPVFDLISINSNRMRRFG